MPRATGAARMHGQAGTDRSEGRFHQPTVRECALLILRLLQPREQDGGRELTRARISQASIRRLWARGQISTEFVLEVQEFLLAAGWCLFCIGPSYFAVIKVERVQGWPRVSSSRIRTELIEVEKGRGQAVFERVERILLTRAEELQQANNARRPGGEEADE